MNKEEMYAFTDRLRKLYKNAWQLNDTGLMNEYYLSFRPYSHKDVDQALTAHRRRKPFFPEPADLTGGFPDPVAQVGRNCPYSPRQLQRIDEQMDEMLALGERLNREGGT